MKSLKWLLAGFLLTITVGVVFGAKITEDTLKLCVPGTADACTIVFDTNDGASNMSIQADSGQLKINNGPLTSSQITASDIDLGTASNTSRLTVGKSDSATLLGLTRKEGTVHYDTSQANLVFDDGVDLRPVGSGGGAGEGGINTVENPGAEINAANWTESGGTFSRTVGASNVGLGTGAFEWDASATSQTLDSDSVPLSSFKILQNKLCTLNFFYKDGDANLTVGVHDGSNYISAVKTLSTQASYVGTGHITFVCPSSGNMFVRFASTADAAAIHFDQVFLGTTVPLYGAVVGDMKSYTPSISGFSSPTSAQYYYKRTGDSIYVQGSVKLSGAVSAQIQIGLPTGLTMDASKMPNFDGIGGTNQVLVGEASGSIGATTYSARTLSRSSGTEVFFAKQDEDGTTSTGSDWDGAFPATWASADTFRFWFIAPITEWAGTSLVFQPTADDLTVGPWRDISSSFDSGASDTTNVVWTARRRRDGPYLEIEFKGVWSGAGSTTQTFTLPSDVTLDAEFLNGQRDWLGKGTLYDSGLLRYPVSISVSGSTIQAYFIAESTNTGTVFQNTMPITPGASDTFYGNIRIPITEYKNIGSVPAIGVEQAGDGVVGLAGPTNDGDESSTSEVCVANCDACIVDAIRYAKIGKTLFWTFSASLDATASSQVVHCDIDSFGGANASLWTMQTDVLGTCSVTANSNTANVGAVVFAEIAGNKIRIRAQDPYTSSALVYYCSGSTLIR